MSPLIMIHGQYPGVGQSTLTRHLAEVLPGADVLWEDELSEPAIFTRPEFAAVAERFHRHNAEPDTAIGHPTASMLEEAYAALVRTALTHGGIVLMGWSVMDLAEDLDWARADEAALWRHAARTRQILEPVDPVLVRIRGDLDEAIARVTLQRGREWITRRKDPPPGDWVSVRTLFMRQIDDASDRTDRAWEKGGWLPSFEVDGTGMSVAEVLSATVEHLAQRGIEVPSDRRDSKAATAESSRHP